MFFSYAELHKATLWRKCPYAKTVPNGNPLNRLFLVFYLRRNCSNASLNRALFARLTTPIGKLILLFPSSKFSPRFPWTIVQNPIHPIELRMTKKKSEAASNRAEIIRHTTTPVSTLTKIGSLPILLLLLIVIMILLSLLYFPAPLPSAPGAGR